MLDPSTEDAELDARRKRLKKSFDDVEVNDSEVRQQLPYKPLSSSRRNGSRSKVPKAQSSRSQTTDATPAGASDAADAGQATPPPPTALGRPPKRLKTAAKIKIS